MARKHRRESYPGDEEFIPFTAEERRAHADALRQRAEREPAERAGLLSEAGEYYAMLGENDLAEQVFRQALDEDGMPAGATHGCYASFLFDQGRDTEAFDLINQARRLRPDEPDVYTLIGEALLEHGHPSEAARWFTTGLVRTRGDLAEIELDDLTLDSDIAILVRGRHEARQALDQPTDHLDEIYERFRAERASE